MSESENVVESLVVLYVGFALLVNFIVYVSYMFSQDGGLFWLMAFGAFIICSLFAHDQGFGGLTLLILTPLVLGFAGGGWALAFFTYPAAGIGTLYIHLTSRTILGQKLGSSTHRKS